ncbi:ABC transporter ATP-binding protein [Halobaculum sp. D14]|uniref:ABC transporter ATP-binding protein n=1 Tax=unclassified Halobaculum TaxID=2640896 RepID=UPI003EBABC52
MSEITLDSVTKRFADTTAVDDVSLTIRDGETLGVVGPSGCGKTTTLRLLAGFETPTGGVVRFDGEDVTHVPPERRTVGLVFQSYALFDNMTVRGNVEFGMKMHGVPAADRVHGALRLLRMLGIADLAERDPRTLSGGQQQRVGLARALAVEPRVLLLDEPMTGLDAKLKHQLRAEIGALLDDLDVTTLYVTHDQEQAMAMCDRIAVMNDGVVEQVGTPEAVYERPTSAFVADFVGTSNLLTATVRDGALDFGFTAVDAPRDSAVDFDYDADSADGGGNADDDGDGDVADRAGDVTVTVRPDDVVVAADGSDAGPPAGDATATVADRFYLGEKTEVVLDVDGGPELTAELGRHDPVPAVGATVSVGVDPAGIHVVDGDEWPAASTPSAEPPADSPGERAAAPEPDGGSEPDR